MWVWCLDLGKPPCCHEGNAKTIISTAVPSNILFCKKITPYLLKKKKKERERELVAIFYSRGFSQPRDQTQVSLSTTLAGGFFNTAPPGRLVLSALLLICTQIQEPELHELISTVPLCLSKTPLPYPGLPHFQGISIHSSCSWSHFIPSPQMYAYPWNVYE